MLYPNSKYDVTTSSLYPLLHRYTNPIQYRSLKIAASLTPVGLRQRGRIETRRRVGEMVRENERERKNKYRKGSNASQCEMAWLMYVGSASFLEFVSIRIKILDRSSPGMADTAYWPCKVHLFGSDFSVHG